VVKHHSAAPLDWRIQLAGSVLHRWLFYPAVLGADLLGEVGEVRPGPTRFRAGDRVLGRAVGMERDHNNPAEGAYHDYTVVQVNMAAAIPAGTRDQNAAALPLARSTAACALFEKDGLALEYPSVNPRPTGQTVLVWGGSTSVGSNAIQLAVAAGYEVITTCSPKNFGYVRRLGARKVFDDRSNGVAGQIITALTGRTLAGVLAIGEGSHGPCAEILRSCEGSKTLVFTTAPGSSVDDPIRRRPTALGLAGAFPGMGVSTAALMRRRRRLGIALEPQLSGVSAEKPLVSLEQVR